MVTEGAARKVGRQEGWEVQKKLCSILGSAAAVEALEQRCGFFIGETRARGPLG